MTNTVLTDTPSKPFNTFVTHVSLEGGSDGSSGTIMIVPSDEGDKGIREDGWEYKLPEKAWNQLKVGDGKCIALSQYLYISVKRSKKNIFEVSVVGYTEGKSTRDVHDFGECHNFSITRRDNIGWKSIEWIAVYGLGGSERSVRKERILNYLGEAETQNIEHSSFVE